MGHQVIRSKLFVGDYAKLKDQSICIDTKKDILEVAGNICGKQHDRFRAECVRAMCSEIKLIILIEEETDTDDTTYYPIVNIPSSPGEIEEDQSTLSIYLSREDLANLSNMTTSNAIRTLSNFATEKLITIDGRKIKIIEEEKLKKISKIG